MRSGVISRLPYSLSRWTDVCAGKWDWFIDRLLAGKMTAFDPQTAVPEIWSLDPKDTLGLVFWTKDPTNLIKSSKLLEPYNVVVQMTATGWTEAEDGPPNSTQAGILMSQASETFEKVYWRFSPVPLLPFHSVLSRFYDLLSYAVRAGIKSVYVSFLQENDRVPETRSTEEKIEILNKMTEQAVKCKIQLFLCADDQDLVEANGLFSTGVCVPETDFINRNLWDHVTDTKPLLTEECGCVKMVDPFTINEACAYNCSYCYAGDEKLSPERRDTT